MKNATLAAAAWSHLRFAQRRAPATLLVRAFNPTLERDGWTSDHTIVETVNDDMPFLVDSIANVIAARQLTIHRLLHPVVCVTRDEKGVLSELVPLCDDKNRRESMMYIELDRADARERQELAGELRAALADVRAAVRDWHQLQSQMRADAEGIEDPEGRALLANGPSPNRNPTRPRRARAPRRKGDS